MICHRIFIDPQISRFRILVVLRRVLCVALRRYGGLARFIDRAIGFDGMGPTTTAVPARAARLPAPSSSPRTPQTRRITLPLPLGRPCSWSSWFVPFFVHASAWLVCYEHRLRCYPRITPSERRFAALRNELGSPSRTFTDSAHTSCRGSGIRRAAGDQPIIRPPDALAAESPAAQWSPADPPTLWVKRQRVPASRRQPRAPGWRAPRRWVSFVPRTPPPAVRVRWPVPRPPSEPFAWSSLRSSAAPFLARPHPSAASAAIRCYRHELLCRGVFASWSQSRQDAGNELAAPERGV
ncbi:hypothetical protein MSIMFI_04205 [Mycobacterium simulans]|nr:hypothetical protein MSIMFI_04205 [Mycobacterium simulans]